MKKFFKDFKTFISKGNVFDMAVGLIIATAFNKIVSSLVNDIIMPLVTWATGASSLSELSVALRTGFDAAGNEIVTLSWAYGNFIQTVIDFLIIAFSVFCMVKFVTASSKKFKQLESHVAEQTKKEIRQAKKVVKEKAKLEGKPFKQAWKEHKIMVAKEETLKEEAEKAKTQEAVKKVETQEEILKDIRLLLQNNLNENNLQATESNTSDNITQK